MSATCQAIASLRHIRSGQFLPVAFVGGSLTVGSGSSNVAVTSWRRLFMRYLHEQLEPTYHCKIGEVMLGIGAMRSFGMSFMLPRYVPSKRPALAFVEFCVNDRRTPSRDLVRKGIEGVIRQLRGLPSNPDVVVLGAATRHETRDHQLTEDARAIHKEAAEHYGVTYLDLDSYIHEKLTQRGQTWDAIGVDNYHLNDYGNRLWFECVREWFERQIFLYDQDPTAAATAELPPALFSDELAHTKLVDPTRTNKGIELEGRWEKAGDVCLPWYMDSVLVGRPGDTLTYTFSGTGIGMLSGVHANGLKIEAVLDGKEIVGPYTNWLVDFGNYEVLAHGLGEGEHVLRLEVGSPQRGKNVEDPTVRIGYFGVAAGSESKD